MAELPSGTVTFLFTDIEGSTALWERDRTMMAAAVERHLALLRGAVETHGGVRFKIVGDAVQAAFPTAPDAVAAALDAQRSLVTESRSPGDGPITVRMALHTAAATPQDGDYLAPGLNRLSRLLAAAHGGQVLLKAEAAAFTLPARDHYERAHARATEALGDSAQAVAAAGRALTLDQALAEAEAVLQLDRNESAGATPAP